jgi:hypothetical protein
MANRLRIAHDSYVNHALLSCCYDESTLIQFINLGVFVHGDLIQFTIRIAGESCGESSGDLP